MPPQRSISKHRLGKAHTPRRPARSVTIRKGDIISYDRAYWLVREADDKLYTLARADVSHRHGQETFSVRDRGEVRKVKSIHLMASASVVQSLGD